MKSIERIQDIVHRFFDSDIWFSFKKSSVTVIAACVTAVMMVSAIAAPLIAPHTPFEPATLDLMDAFTPPFWYEDGSTKFLLGTDDQGRDLFSTILYGSRISIFVGFASMLLAMIIGITLGLISGYIGGAVETFIMRIADVQISFPGILIAMLIYGVALSLLPNERHDEMVIWVLIVAIGLSNWVNFARTVRGSTLVEKNKEYVQAARVIGRRRATIMFGHILPNVMGPVLVIATIGLAVAILSEATLSFLGVGVPPTKPSLGTLIRIGQDFLFAGEWWIVIFPGIALAVLVLAVNLLGDWMRDAFNPKLR
ncbi:MAG: ABC transporter permease [Desulfobacterales bacterium]|jgi:peptide/nickel transport system permease protein